MADYAKKQFEMYKKQNEKWVREKKGELARMFWVYGIGGSVMLTVTVFDVEAL